jgi:hypothetical protein
MVKLLLGNILLPYMLLFNLPANTSSPARQQGRDERPAIRHKIDLWRGTTYLRGANLWQKVEGGELSPSFTRSDLHDLKSWGANYVNISHPGIYGVHKIKNPATGRKEYAPDDALLTNLKTL